MVSFLSWLVFGWLVGAVHKWFVPATRTMTAIELAGVGVAGSIIGGLIEALISGQRYHPAGFLFSVIGACAAVWIYRTHLADLVSPTTSQPVDAIPAPPPATPNPGAVPAAAPPEVAPDAPIAPPPVQPSPQEST
jgi:uncharacterized membrane protein YeaQ/YmgE (transglycosylase-associated protein family)